MLVSDLRAKFKAKAIELAQEESKANLQVDPEHLVLPKPWVYKHCKGDQDPLKHISQAEFKKDQAPVRLKPKKFN